MSTPVHLTHSAHSVVSVQFDPKARVCADEALRHRYFNSFGDQVHVLPDSEFHHQYRPILAVYTMYRHSCYHKLGHSLAIDRKLSDHMTTNTGVITTLIQIRIVLKGG